jgi:ATP-dependent RNA helicase DDX55/SPB4
MSNKLRFDEILPKLSEATLTALADEFGFTHMTPVQATTIPLFLRNKDVCVEATTGTVSDACHEDTVVVIVSLMLW